MEDEELVPIIQTIPTHIHFPSSHCLNMVISQFLVKSLCLLPIPPGCPLDFSPGRILCPLPLLGPSFLGWGVGEKLMLERHRRGKIVDILDVWKCLYSILQPIHQTLVENNFSPEFGHHCCFVFQLLVLLSRSLIHSLRKCILRPHSFPDMVLGVGKQQ